MVDYYKVLDVPRNASVAEIKRAYRKLALRWHPDKNPHNVEEATVRFREVSEAYEVLADDRKRRQYDQYGKDGLKGPNRSRQQHRQQGNPRESYNYPFNHGFMFPGFSFRDPEDVFREFFKGDPFANLFDDFFFHGAHSSRSRGHQAQRQSRSLFQPLSLNLFSPSFDSFFGGQEPLLKGGNFSSVTTFGSSGLGSNNPSVKRTSTTTRFVNGKRIVTKKVQYNGEETVTVTENGVLKSRSVNGAPQLINF